MNKAKIAVWAIAAVVVVGLGALILAPQAGVENVDGAGMEGLVAQGVRIIDVRTDGEYQTGHIPGSENVPISEFEAAAPTWDRSQPIAIYCATGERSISAVQYLQSLDFEKVYHFDAGLIAYSGDLESGMAVAQATPDVEPLDGPVLYEFYTDW